MSGSGLTLVCALLAMLAGCGMAWSMDTAGTAGRRLRRRPVTNPAQHRVGRLLTRSRLLSAVAAGLIGWLLIPAPLKFVLAPAAAVIALWTLSRLEPAAVARRTQQLTLQQPHVLDLLAAVLSAGSPLRTATAVVAEVAEQPTAGLLSGVTDLVQIGVSDADAWRSLAEHPVWGQAARDIARSSDSGTALVDTLAMHADDSRRRRRLLLEGKAQSAGVKAVLPLVCCYLPAFVLVGVVPIIAGSIGQFLGR